MFTYVNRNTVVAVTDIGDVDTKLKLLCVMLQFRMTIKLVLFDIKNSMTYSRRIKNRMT